jgi:hypothetical protein
VCWKPWSSAEGRWHTLATNKYGKPVAGVIEPEADSGQGWIFVLPRITDKGALARGLLEDLLPRLAPKLLRPFARRTNSSPGSAAMPPCATSPDAPRAAVGSVHGSNSVQ